MAMVKGSVTINSQSGSASGSGAAFEVFDALDSTIDYQGLSGSALAAAKQQIANIAEAVAAIIDHIKNNAVVSTSVNTTTVGTATGVMSGGASAPTTGTGSGSGSGTVS